MSAEFDIANWFSMAVGLIALAAIGMRRIGQAEFLVILGFGGMMTAFAFWSSPGVLLNLALLLLSLYFMFHPRQLAVLKGGLSKSLNWFGIGFLIVLFIFPIILKGSGSWLIVLSVALKYWFIYSACILYVFAGDPRVRSWIAISILGAGLIWPFKLALIVFAMLLVHYLASTRSPKRLVSIFAGVALVSGASFFFLRDQLMLFLQQSIFRPDNDYDTKILGFSDGNRLNIWIHYLENTVWLGKGGYTLSDIVPSHNIFVHLAHEVGNLGLVVIGPVFVFLFVRLAIQVGIVFSGLVALSLNLSSIGEYPSMWVYPFVLAPVFLSSSFFHKKIVLHSRSKSLANGSRMPRNTAR